MKKTITSAILFLLLAVNSAFAQFTADDVVFWIGEGDSEAILVIDFRDETTDPSFAWGYRFNAGEGKTFADMLLAVETAEPELDVVINGGFLSSIYYNHHEGVDSQPDWWSTWSGTSLTGLTMNGGVSEALADGGWYGTSYGFMNPEPTQPTVTYPAYSSLWFTADELTYSIGEGSNSAVIVVDFVSDEGNADNSYAWQINFDGTITPQQALELIAQNNVDFSITFDGTDSTVTYGDLTANLWTAYNGTNLSDWVVGDFTTAIENDGWFGISAGNNERRPFTPVPAEASVEETVVSVQTENEIPAEITVDNGTLQLVAIITPADFVQTVTWSIESGSDFAEVDQNGLVTALDNGTTVIRATSTEDTTKFGEITVIITNQNGASTESFSRASAKVYPNPATDFFTVAFENNIKSINVFNISGQKVFTQTVNNTSETISTNNLSKGLYFVEITTENGTSVQKLVIK